MIERIACLQAVHKCSTHGAGSRLCACYRTAVKGPNGRFAQTAGKQSQHVQQQSAAAHSASRHTTRGCLPYASRNASTMAAPEEVSPAAMPAPCSAFCAQQRRGAGGRAAQQEAGQLSRERLLAGGCGGFLRWAARHVGARNGGVTQPAPSHIDEHECSEVSDCTGLTLGL